MSRPDPAPKRGGDGDPLAKLRPKGMKKAPSRSVIAEMGTSAESSVVPPALHAVPSSKEQPELSREAAAETVQQLHQYESHEKPAPARKPDPEPVRSVPTTPQTSQPTSENVQKKLKKTGYWEPPEFGERMRAAFVDTAAAEGHESLSAFICAVLEREVERLEEKYNGGERYRKGARGVRRGRPVGS